MYKYHYTYCEGYSVKCHLNILNIVSLKSVLIFCINLDDDIYTSLGKNLWN